MSSTHLNIKQFGVTFLLTTTLAGGMTFTLFHPSKILAYMDQRNTEISIRKEADTAIATQMETTMEVLKNISSQVQAINALPSEQQEYEKRIRETSEEIPLCAYGIYTKSYMDADTVTDEDSLQYKLLSQMHINEKGLYETDDGYVAIALGSYYGGVGTKYLITLDTGVTFKAIKADEKADEHVYDGCIHKVDGSMMEFILDTDKASQYFGLSNGYVAGGNLNNSNDYRGDIVEIRQVTI